MDEDFSAHYITACLRASQVDQFWNHTAEVSALPSFCEVGIVSFVEEALDVAHWLDLGFSAARAKSQSCDCRPYFRDDLAAQRASSF